MQNKPIPNETTKPPVFRTRIRTLASLVTGLTGLANMLTAILPRPSWDVLLGAWPVDTHHGVNKLLIVIGFFLVMLSYGMMRGKRQAWLATTMLLLVSAFLYMLNGGAVFTASLTVSLALPLIVFAGHFRAKSNPPSIWRWVIALPTGLGTVVR